MIQGGSPATLRALQHCYRNAAFEASVVQDKGGQDVRGPGPGWLGAMLGVNVAFFM